MIGVLIIRKMCAFKQLGIRYQHSLPLLDTTQLLLQGLPRPGTEATVPLRDFVEWVSIQNSRHNNFFAPKPRYRPYSLPSLSLFEPLLSHCLARWLLVDYKLNSYPYYDLNVVTMYTDFHQSLRITRSIVKFLKETAPDDLYQRINCFLVPLYDETKEIKIPDKKIRVIKHGALSANSSLFIEDPVYVLMINDVIRHLSHDYILKTDTLWKQCYVDIEQDSARSRRFDSQMDYWCQLTYELLKEPLTKSGLSDTYIPSRLVQLFFILKQCVPEHKLIAMDLSQSRKPSLLQAFKNLCRKGSSYQPSNVLGPNDILSATEPTTFVSDFSQVKHLYGVINDGMKVCQVESLNDFAKDWTDLEQSAKILGANHLEIQAGQLSTSNITVLHG